MPDKPLTVATYAAGAGLAAITLFYVFGPTFFIDGDPSTASGSTRKKGIVGLSNPANDCFINSVLQSLAGLGDLRQFLIRESHRRHLDGASVYNLAPEEKLGKRDAWKLEGQQKGIVTQALKEVLDSLNERPIYKKTISAGGFLAVLEHAFRLRISRTQQDAQEFLQVVAERLSEEYHAGRKARRRARLEAKDHQDEPVVSLNSEPLQSSDGNLKEKNQWLTNGDGVPQEPGNIHSSSYEHSEPKVPESAKENSEKEDEMDQEEGFPLEGKLESQIRCLTCQFIPKPSITTFVMLTLNVPQVSSTSLNSCFDGLFQTEYIDDYKCDKCRLAHALQMLEQMLPLEKLEKRQAALQSDIRKIRTAIEEDPEKPPEGVVLPDMKYAPKRRIAKHVRIAAFPKIMAIHLSRSIFDPRSASTKNSAKVAFPERLPLGGLLEQKKYKLLGVVTHKGSHHSGHYESFRRQNLYPPFSTPNAFTQGGIYCQRTISPSANPSPKVSSEELKKPSESAASSPATVGLTSPSTTSKTSSPPRSSISTRPSIDSSTPSKPQSPFPRDLVDGQSLNSGKSEALSPSKKSLASDRRASKTPSMIEAARLRRRKKPNDRWWRISDERVKESSTNEVLNMQKEVYMLFYELDKRVEGGDGGVAGRDGAGKSCKVAVPTLSVPFSASLKKQI
ncbi:MAG: hypothetical protein M1829_006098 [Trizodia sp. TS-e1964]|nr:MAG: hypothetical protein M1829_006098 [Trizodia sp. TS-e1964]